MSSIYLYLGIYIAVLLTIVYFISRRETSEDFLISGRDRKGWQIFLSKFAGSIGASWFVTYTAYAYQYGFGTYGTLLGFIAGYFLFAYWAVPKIYKNSRSSKFYTQGDYVYSEIKSTTAKVATNMLSVIIQWSWLLVGIVSGAKIMNYFGFISYEVALLITVGIVLAYILLAGFKAVIITDIFQAIIIFVLMTMLTFIIIKDTSVTEIVTADTGNLTFSAFIGFFLYGLMSVFALADRYQLVYCAKTEKDIKNGIGYAIIPILIVATFLVIIGVFMYMQSSSLDPDLVFLQAMKDFLPKSLIPVGIVLFFAGLMSSTDTNIYTIASHFVFSFDKKERNHVKEIRYTTIVLLLISTVIALVFRNIVNITIFGGAATLSIAIPMIYIIKGGKSTAKFLGSIIAAITGLFLGIAFFGFEPVIALTVLIGSALGLLTPKHLPKFITK